MKKNIYCITGPSGCGKTTLADALEAYGYKVVQSYTTRPRRTLCETGHIFVSDKMFDKLSPLCAYTEYNGYRYGVPTFMVDESDVYVIDPPGIQYLRLHYHGKRKIKVIQLTATEETLKQRMKERGDSLENIQKRIGYDRNIVHNENPDLILSAELPPSEVLKQTLQFMEK